MKEKIISFIHNLIIYDYILFGTVFILFILFIILAIVVRNRVGFSIFLVLFSFIFLVFAPFFGYIQMHKYLFKNSTTLISQKRLHFTKALIVKGSITNQSKTNFKSCVVTISAYKVTNNKYKNMLYKLKPFQKMSILEKSILRGETKKFRVIVEPFTYAKDYNISLEADCK